MKETPQQEIDAARRCADTITGLLAEHKENAFGKWVAVRLSDGGTDGIMYDTKQEAVRFQIHEMLCAYVCILPTGMPIDDALDFLRINRKLYAAGMRISDPDRHVQMPMRKEHR